MHFSLFSKQWLIFCKFFIEIILEIILEIMLEIILDLICCRSLQN